MGRDVLKEGTLFVFLKNNYNCNFHVTFLFISQLSLQRNKRTVGNES